MTLNFDGCYWLYEHKGLKYSIFMEDRQVAAFTKNRVKIGKGDRYDIRANHDANIIVIICLALTMDASEYEDDEESLTIDIGNVGPQEKAFDKSWVPT